MAASAESRGREEFYAKVRKRTAESWKKKYITLESESAETEELLQRLKSKPESVYSVNNLIWFLASIGVFYLTDITSVIFYDARIERMWLKIGAACLSVSVLCCLYCIIWLSWVKCVHSDKWEEHNMFVIPVATVAGLIGGASICYSLWPVWGILTLPIVGSQFMGFIVIIAMIPDIF